MATSSFSKTFAIKDKKSSQRFLEAVAQPRTVNIEDKNLQSESKKGLELLARRFKISNVTTP